MEMDTKINRPLVDLNQNGQKKAVQMDQTRLGITTMVRNIINRKKAYVNNNTYLSYKPIPAGFYLTIDKLSSELLVENRPYRVYFTLWNHTGAVTKGYVMAQVQPLKSLNPYNGNFNYEVKELQPSESVSGVITFYAPISEPPAEGKNKINVYYYVPEQPPSDLPPGSEWFGRDIVEAKDGLEFDVAARYSLTVDRITIFDTASLNDDTLIISISSFKETQPTGDVSYLGDHNNGSFLVQVNELGPYDLTPGVSPDVALAWLVANYGFSSDQAKLNEVLNILSDIGAAIATIIMGGVFAPLSAGADALNHFINNYLLANCDSVVALNGKIFTSQELYDLTFDPLNIKSSASNWVRSKKSVNDPLSMWLGKGCRDSDYNIEWKATRYRSPNEVASIFSEDGIKIGYGEKVHIGYVTREAVTWDWYLEGEGSSDLFGNFKAPDQKGLNNYAVMIGIGLVDGVEKYSGFTVIFFE